MESASASNGNTVELAGTEDSQVLTQTRAKVGRLNNSLRNLKGQLTREVNNCYKKIAHLKPYCPQIGWELLLSRLNMPGVF